MANNNVNYQFTRETLLCYRKRWRSGKHWRDQQLAIVAGGNVSRQADHRNIEGMIFNTCPFGRGYSIRSDWRQASISERISSFIQEIYTIVNW